MAWKITGFDNYYADKQGCKYSSHIKILYLSACKDTK